MKFISKIVFFVLLSQTTSAQNFDYVWNIGTATSAVDETYAVLSDANGNAYVLGSFDDVVDLDNGSGTCIMTPVSPYGEGTFLMKMDSSGSFVWAKQLPRIFFSGFTIDDEGNFVITGGYNNSYQDVDPGSSSSFFLDPPVSCSWASVTGGYFVLKLDNAGNFVWAKSFLGNCGSYDPHTNDIMTDEIGNIYVSGYYYDTLDFIPGPGVFELTTGGDVQSNAFVQKFDVNGNVIWVKQLEGPGQEMPYAIEFDQAGNILVGGGFQRKTDFDPGLSTFIAGSDSLDFNMFFLKLDTAGNFITVKDYTEPYDQMMTDIRIDAAGNIYATGILKDSVDFDPGVGTFWTTPTNTSDYDFFVLKLDSNFNLTWVHRFGPVYNLEPKINIDNAGSVYTAGSYQPYNTIDLDPGPAVDTFDISVLGVFIQKLDASGNFVWSRSIDAHLFRAFHVDNFTHVYLGGFFEGTIDFDPNAGVSSLSSYAAAYLMRLNQHGIITMGTNSDIETNSTMLVYPNPASTSVIIMTNKTVAQKIMLCDVAGRIIKTVQPNSNQTLLDLQNVESGIYFVNVVNGNSQQTVKIVKQ